MAGRLLSTTAYLTTGTSGSRYAMASARRIRAVTRTVSRCRRAIGS